jgi:superfamily II DNA or RNA helicase
MQLRPYQIQIVDEVVSSDRNRMLIVLPTGGGKTIIMAAICDKKNKKTLLLAHRDELLYQAKNRIKDYAPHIKTSICSEGNTDFSGDVVIGSVQTLCRKLDQLRAFNPSIVMVDEAHHAQAETYKKILYNLEHAQWIGVTATPDRSDNKDIEQIFGKPIQYSRTIRQMIKDGFLSPIISKKLFTHVDLGKIKTSGEDFSGKNLAELVDIPQRNEFVVDKYIEHASDRKAIFFGVNVEHSENLNETFQSKGIKSEVIHAQMPMENRREILSKFSNRDLDVLVNCLILTEGFDDPEVSCIGMTRPTKSYSLYTQCIGRGLRMFPGKTNCLVLDFTDTVQNKNKPLTLDRIVPRDPREDIEKKKSGAITRNECCEYEIDTLNPPFIWHDLGNNIFGISDDRNYLYVYPFAGSFYYDHYIVKDRKLEKKMLSQPYTDFETCYHQALDYAEKNMNKITYQQRHLDYQASVKQIALIETLGYKKAMPKTLAEANLVISKLFMQKGLSKITMGKSIEQAKKEKISQYMDDFIHINNVYILDRGFNKIVIYRETNGWFIEEYNSDTLIWRKFTFKGLEDAKSIAIEQAIEKNILPIRIKDPNIKATENQMEKIRKDFPWDYRDNLTKGEATQIIATNFLEEFIQNNEIRSVMLHNYPVPCVI